MKIDYDTRGKSPEQLEAERDYMVGELNDIDTPLSIVAADAIMLAHDHGSFEDCPRIYLTVIDAINAAEIYREAALDQRRPK